MTTRIDQWLGNLFFRGVAPGELEAMPYHKLRYWNDWHKVIEKAERDATRAKG